MADEPGAWQCLSCGDHASREYPVGVLRCGHVLCTFCARDGCPACELAQLRPAGPLDPRTCCVAAGATMLWAYNELDAEADAAELDGATQLTCLLRDLAMWAQTEGIDFLACLTRAREQAALLMDGWPETWETP